MNNTYVSGMVGGPGDDLGAPYPSPFEPFHVDVRNSGHLDLTVNSEILPAPDPSNSISSTSFYAIVQNTATNVLNLALISCQGPTGYQFTQLAGTFTLLGTGANLPAGLASQNTFGGGGNPNQNPPTVVSSGTITLTATAPMLPSITIN